MERSILLAQPRYVFPGQEDKGNGPFGFIIENKRYLSQTPLTKKEIYKENRMPASQNNNIHFTLFSKFSVLCHPIFSCFFSCSCNILCFLMLCFHFLILKSLSSLRLFYEASSLLYQYTPTSLLNISTPDSADGLQISITYLTSLEVDMHY